MTDYVYIVQRGEGKYEPSYETLKAYLTEDRAKAHVAMEEEKLNRYNEIVEMLRDKYKRVRGRSSMPVEPEVRVNIIKMFRENGATEEEIQWFVPEEDDFIDHYLTRKTEVHFFYETIELDPT